MKTLSEITQPLKPPKITENHSKTAGAMPKALLTGTGERIMKAMSRRRSEIKKLLDHRQSKEDLVKMGIHTEDKVGFPVENTPKSKFRQLLF